MGRRYVYKYIDAQELQEFHVGIGSNINVIFKLKYEDEYQTITQTLITYY